ncbi:MBL fold metallo-hydrolase [Vreelandella nanhaiensis]|uniref:MBL fold metallo-hydrolase n=1 Tax=Vreelandella nanhaiensis TaxID=1258546 RepID=A0A3S0WNB9_9GAMM|nr:MBL fold metallo-hydrolase [Halomonas nanhaiensis]RUR33710.1 MBL fold metallo-hydrolase [Halomonas nanhaiensis]
MSTYFSKCSHSLLAVAVSVGWAATVQAELPTQQQEQAPGWFRMLVGEYEVTALYDGHTAIDTSLLKGIEQDEILRHLDALFIDAENGMQTAVNAFLIHTGENLVLVDAGSAACFGPSLGQVESNLRASGYTSDDVDTVLMTHLHPDHACGLTNENGEAVYPNAELRVSQADADFWLDEARAAELPEEERDFFVIAQEAVSPYQKAGRFSSFTPGDELLKGIVAQDTHGHTPGHSSFMLNSDEDAMLVWGDVVHSYGVQFADPSVAIEFDSDPEQAIRTRESVLESAVADKHWVAGAHMPFPGIGHVAKDETGYRWLPIEFGPVADNK